MLLVLSCFFDYRRGKVPNALVLIGLVLAYCCRAQQSNIGIMSARIVLVLILLYPLYMLGMLGAGDIKLYCMSAAYLAGKDYIIFFLCSLLFSAIAAFLKMLFLGNLWERIHYFYLYAVDVAKKRKLFLYQKGIVFERKKGALHMTGPMLTGFVLYLCIAY
ncbi:MAG: A24 family peptidase [Lachnospiraceae bacterium]